MKDGGDGISCGYIAMILGYGLSGMLFYQKFDVIVSIVSKI